MKPHTLGLHQVDVCSPGWFSHTNPTYHSKECVKDDIYLHANSAMDDFSDETKQDLVDTFPEYVSDENKFEIPEFQLIHCSIVGKGSHMAKSIPRLSKFKLKGSTAKFSNTSWN